MVSPQCVSSGVFEVDYYKRKACRIGCIDMIFSSMSLLMNLKFSILIVSFTTVIKQGKFLSGVCSHVTFILSESFFYTGHSYMVASEKKSSNNSSSSPSGNVNLLR
ncbi:unnamed protein product [Meganyctiphanes norvegica]|uniref:Uncharacterized protein n=1 Tax=Meganyctiphanes norvegica TaxID=48144 RepID=A0AAV2S599_MEGNR